MEVQGECINLSNALKEFKEFQLSYGEDFEEFKEKKKKVCNRKKALNELLNKRLFGEYGGKREYTDKIG